MRPHISYSELTEFGHPTYGCQQKWYLNYAKEKRSKENSIHFDFGHAIHFALENHKRRKDPATVEQALQLFRESFKVDFEKNRASYKKRDEDKAKNDAKVLEEYEEMIKAGERILTRLDECDELKDADVIYNEHPLMVKIDREDSIDIKFKGFIDFVIRTKAKNGDTVLYVCDFKTCQWGWSAEKRSDKWVHYQVMLYKHFLCKELDLDPKYVRTAFILLKKRPPLVSKGSIHTVSPVEFFPVSAGPVSVQRALDVLNENITEMDARLKTGEFKKNRDVCKDSFGNVCPYFNTEDCP